MIRGEAARAVLNLLARGRCLTVLAGEVGDLSGRKLRVDPSPGAHRLRAAGAWAGQFPVILARPGRMRRFVLLRHGGRLMIAE